MKIDVESFELEVSRGMDSEFLVAVDGREVGFVDTRGKVAIFHLTVGSDRTEAVRDIADLKTALGNFIRAGLLLEFGEEIDASPGFAPRYLEDRLELAKEAVREAGGVDEVDVLLDRLEQIVAELRQRTASH